LQYLVLLVDSYNIINLYGAPGSGKTRLVRDAVALLNEKGILAIHASHHGGVAYNISGKVLASALKSTQYDEASDSYTPKALQSVSKIRVIVLEEGQAAGEAIVSATAKQLRAAHRQERV
jgi:tRNA uridine 5-carbamoylmethylation protein Kti12